MEYIEGTPLKSPLPLDRALKNAAQICDALDAAHRKGNTDPDLKPANIVVTISGVKLLDTREDVTQNLGLTEAATILGTASNRLDFVRHPDHRVRR